LSVLVPGIGFYTALDFAKRGARVILACRDQPKAEEARLKIIQKTKNVNVLVKHLDLASFQSVRDFAQHINSTEERLDILVNNAGVLGVGNAQTKDGHDLVIQVNHFSVFLLTHLLLGRVHHRDFSLSQSTSRLVEEIWT
jgi:retinol dehydrogenase-11